MPIDQNKVAAVIRKITALKAYTEMTGVKTTRSQHELLANLNAEETVLVAEAYVAAK